MAFLGIDKSNFIWSSPIFISGLIIALVLRKVFDLYGKWNTPISGFINLAIIWTYTGLLAKFKCNTSWEYSFKNGWKPNTVFIIYFIGMIVLNTASYFFTFLRPLKIINIVLNNFIVMYFVAAVAWYPVLKSTYSDCF
jgi:hypothetical protein